MFFVTLSLILFAYIYIFSCISEYPLFFVFLYEASDQSIKCKHTHTHADQASQW